MGLSSSKGSPDRSPTDCAAMITERPSFSLSPCSSRSSRVLQHPAQGSEHRNRRQGRTGLHTHNLVSQATVCPRTSPCLGLISICRRPDVNFRPQPTDPQRRAPSRQAVPTSSRSLTSTIIAATTVRAYRIRVRHRPDPTRPSRSHGAIPEARFGHRIEDAGQGHWAAQLTERECRTPRERREVY